ncbi:hypothetical protein [Butyricimonas virosa]|uniref:hypothetical protein n=1 Tax=Butyricimonas virosa TaxID=544645 RepID=UPI003AAAC9B6
MKDFFYNSHDLDRMVLKPLEHINPNWELTWDEEKEEYKPEDGSFAEKLNKLIQDIEIADSPQQYHDNEDKLANNVLESLNWEIEKICKRWDGADYNAILEQGSFQDSDQKNLITSAKGRIQAAFEREQFHFDDMEEGHKKMLAFILTTILYHRM